VARFLTHDVREPGVLQRADGLAKRLRIEQVRIRAWLFALTAQTASWFLENGDQTTWHELEGVLDGVVGLR
jgi:streptomycin 6-kinase